MNLCLEDRLLLCCGRAHMSTEIADEVKGLLRSGPNWDRLVDQASRHGLAPLLYFNLSRIEENGIPHDVLRKLRSAYYGNLCRNTLLYEELRAVLKAFKRTGVRTILLKGAALAEFTYRNIALRPMSDMDILIKREDLSTVKHTFDQLGYRPLSSAPPSSKWHIGWVEHIPTYVKQEDPGIRFEVHLEMATHYEARVSMIDSGRAWENAIPVTICGIQDILILSAQDLLIRLCLHASKHVYKEYGGMLIWWSDIAEVEKDHRREIDWENVVSTSRKWRIEAPMYHSLYAAREWFDANIPPHVLDALRPRFLPMSVEDFCRSVLKGKAYRQMWIKSQISFLGTIDGIFNKIGCGFRILFPIRAFMMHRYPVKRPILVYWYYLIRFSTGLRALYQLLGGCLKQVFLQFQEGDSRA